jgi:hypothetical protein
MFLQSTLTEMKSRVDYISYRKACLAVTLGHGIAHLDIFSLFLKLLYRPWIDEGSACERMNERVPSQKSKGAFQRDAGSFVRGKQWFVIHGVHS